LLGAVTGAGNDQINGTILNFGSSVSAGQTVLFLSGGGTLWLQEAADFHGKVQNFGSGDGIVLAGFNDATLHPLQYTPNSAGTGGTLTVNDGTNIAHITLHRA
jgi:hypothetical protein